MKIDTCDTDFSVLFTFFSDHHMFSPEACYRVHRNYTYGKVWVYVTFYIENGYKVILMV